MRQASKKAS